LRGCSRYGGDLFDLRVLPSLMWGRSRTRLAWIRGWGCRSRGCPPAGPPGPGLGFGERYPPESARQTPRTSSPRVECGRGTRPPAGQIDRTYISTEQAGAGRVSLRPPIAADTSCRNAHHTQAPAVRPADRQFFLPLRHSRRSASRPSTDSGLGIAGVLDGLVLAGCGAEVALTSGVRLSSPATITLAAPVGDRAVIRAGTGVRLNPPFT
jgi:hypothetical protein